jgi:hypothetical protein
MFGTIPNLATFAGTTAMCLGSLVSGASGESLSLQGRARFEPIQAITFEFGSKLTTGYFGACVVTLMLTENGDPEHPLGLSPTRIRLILSPGQVAGFDSDEGRSLNFTCERGAATMLVDIGECDRLVALQDAAVQPHFAKQP